MPYQNRKCNYCGKPYYVCLSCERAGSWKTICCSRECYYKLMRGNNDDVMPQIISEGETQMSAKLKNGKNVNISGYDLQQNRFDCDDGVTRVVDDFSEFTLSNEEMRSVMDILHFFKADVG